MSTSVTLLKFTSVGHGLFNGQAIRVVSNAQKTYYNYADSSVATALQGITFYARVETQNIISLFQDSKLTKPVPAVQSFDYTSLNIVPLDVTSANITYKFVTSIGIAYKLSWINNNTSNTKITWSNYLGSVDWINSI